MTDKWCPFGKMECLQFDKLHNLCSVHNGSGDVGWEVCPWPSRQQPIEPKSENDCPVCKGTGKVSSEHHNFLREQYKIMMAVGRAEGVRECVEALRKIRPMCNIASPLILKDEAINTIAALEGVKGE